MAFAIREKGNRAKVLAHISTITDNGVDGKPVADQSLIDAAKSVVAGMAEKLDEKFGGVLVIIEGHSTENNRAITVQVIGEEGHY